MKTPSVAEKLKREIRGAFASYDDINASSTTSLEYMNAVIQEGMRIYPPLPFGIPRVVPEGGDTVDGHFLPAGVSFTSREFEDGWLNRPSDHRFYQSSCSKPGSSKLP